MADWHEKACGKKHKYADEDAAQKAAVSHNNWEGKKHDVEPYLCSFCGSWHIGGVWGWRSLPKEEETD